MWRPDGEVSAEERARVWTYAGVARKPSQATSRGDLPGTPATR
jgi:hypothetical protein